MVSAREILQNLFSQRPPSSQQVIIFGTVLSIGVILLAPVLAVFLEPFIGGPYNQLVAVGVIGLFYGVVCAYYKEIISGSYAGMLVFLTISMNVPLGDSKYHLAGIGPNIWLVHIPIIILVTYGLVSEDSIQIGRPQKLFALFIVWAGLGAILAPGPRPDMTILFVIFAMTALLISIIVMTAIASGKVSITSTLTTLCIAVIAHVFLGIIQFLNRGPIGVPYLGEGAGAPAAEVSLGPIGAFYTGPFVNGLTFGGPLAVLLTLTIPIVLVFALQKDGKERIGLLLVVCLMLFVHRMSGWDAARGGLLVALSVLLISAGGIQWKKIRELKTVGKGAITTIGMFLILFIPSSGFGQTVRVPNVSSTESETEADSDTGSQTEGGSSGSEASSDTGSQTADGANTPGIEGEKYLDVADFMVHLDGLNIPLFDATNLGIRVHQYVLGLDLALQYPITGIGAANFYFVSEDIGLRTSYHLHNWYIQLLAETGVIGFSLYSGALLLIFVGTIQAILDETDEKRALIIIATLAGTVGVLSQLMFQPQMMKMPSMFSFWAVMGVLAAYIGITNDDLGRVSKDL
ncbi:O-antigen ligase family protein [Natronosalvus rutilus]|uniref:O-antigen ligase family protein n=1 Tax=Natronosalvus rutilus TaxID=2953753 RepID=A0A9E7SVW5_9EURY|nr:O-antigen ligase family protein [Natronosalvus rutilus]UTF54880.1 O-antigen ligase family protein [Natronosalvus rutilus]